MYFSVYAKNGYFSGNYGVFGNWFSKLTLGRVGYALTGIAPHRTVLAQLTHTALHNSIHLR